MREGGWEERREREKSERIGRIRGGEKERGKGKSQKRENKERNEIRKGKEAKGGVRGEAGGGGDTRAKKSVPSHSEENQW